MKIGIVGSGNMGRSLGVLFGNLGHEVFFGARRPEQAEAAAKLSPDPTRFGTNTAAAQFGEVVIWTVRDVVASSVIDQVRAVDGRAVLDMSNLPAQADKRAGRTLSMAEQLQTELPGAHVVKAFNTFAIELFELAPDQIAQHQVSVLLASNFDDAKGLIADLARQIGCVPIDCGPLSNAATLESVGDLIRILIRQGHPLTVALSIRDLPSAESRRLGGRTPSRLS